MTPEAKQAAEKICGWLECDSEPMLDEEREQTAKFVQQAIDAATAKLREELAIMREGYQKGLSYDAYLSGMEEISDNIGPENRQQQTNERKQ